MEQEQQGLVTEVAPDNSIADEAVEGIEGLPETDGTAFGVPPPGQGDEALTDEALAQEDTAPSEGEQEVPTQPSETSPDEPHLARKYQQDWSKADQGYRNLQRMYSREQVARQAEAERREQLEAALRQMAPLLQQQAQQYQPEVEFDPFDPNSVAAYIESQVVERTTEAQQAQMAALQQQQFAESVNGAIASFRQEHPEVAPGSDLDESVAGIMLELQTVTPGERPDPELFPVSTENLSYALELAQNPALYEAVIDLDLLPDSETIQLAKEALANPALYQELKAQPELLDNDVGIEVARRRANLPGVVQQAAAAGVSNARNPQAMKQRAHVETGGTGAPAAGAPGAQPQDEMDEAILAWRGQRSDSIF